MQSEPTESLNIVSDLDTPETHPAIQHGYHHHEAPTLLQHHASVFEEGALPPILAGAPSDTSSEDSSPSGGSEDSSDGVENGLKGPRRATGSPANRISEHEKALGRNRAKKSTGPAFTVISKHGTSGTPGKSLIDFPNEVLTHILSHLSPSSLADIALVSRRFHRLVTTPHAWRSAFSRFFPGPDALHLSDSTSEVSGETDGLQSELRYFTRLTSLATWRSEYILRTRLLRSLGRGKPADADYPNHGNTSRLGSANPGHAQLTYSSNLYSMVNHLEANFANGLNKRLPRFIHGTDDLGTASTSDPRIGKVDNWGSQDFVTFANHSENFPGEATYGLGAGEYILMPNTMDVSPTFGMICGQGFPRGCLWYRHLEQRKGRLLGAPIEHHDPCRGIPRIPHDASVCSVWIAKTNIVPDLSDGVIGLLSGSSDGTLAAFSAGTSGVRDRRLERGEMMARWVLSPGVPIIGIAVDEHLTLARLAASRAWIYVLNALGEVFYLTSMPDRLDVHAPRAINETTHQSEQMVELAWATGRTVEWSLIEATRRIARTDPFNRPSVDGSYSPRSSWNGQHLSRDQLHSETREIETYLRKKPKDFRGVAFGWDMQRQLQVDFAGGKSDGSGESVLVITSGLSDGTSAEIIRYTRCSVFEVDKSTHHGLEPSPEADTDPSLFGQQAETRGQSATWSFANAANLSERTTMGHRDSLVNALANEWRISVLSFGGLKPPQISAIAMDASAFATTTYTEDIEPSTSKNRTVPHQSGQAARLASASMTSGQTPGCRARLLAVGTKIGTIILYDVRAPIAANAIVANHIKPVRIIYTDSPQISCLALTALYLVHGGNDGLVQAWDPLASNTGPLRTLNSRFSSRARRRLVQAEASPAGVGINLFAAGAICLDPDSTVLRGMVSLGSHLRYWSYSSITADQYKGNKRRLRRSERGSNLGVDRITGTGRGILKEYIANEKLELEREKKYKRKEEERLAGRFGLDLLGPGASEDEIMAYATLLSEEAAHDDNERRRKSGSEASSSGTMIDPASLSQGIATVSNDATDQDIAEAIRLSLQSDLSVNDRRPSEGPSDIPIGRDNNVPHSASCLETHNNTDHDADLEYVLQLSRAEEESKVEAAKGKAKAF